MRFLSVLVILAFTCVAKAEWEVTDGNSLARGMALVKRAQASGVLTADEKNTALSTVNYLRGFLGSSSLWSRIDKASPFKFPQDGIPTIQLEKVVDKYFANHPEKLHESADFLVYLALMESFPNPVFKKALEDQSPSD